MATERWQDFVYHPFQVRFTDGRNRYLCVVEGAPGLAIDWDAYARQGTATWEQLHSGKVTRAEMRAMILESVDGSYEHGQFLIAKVTAPGWV
jgi:aminoglycoside phosphotransferase (APT) family kinase protein